MDNIRLLPGLMVFTEVAKSQSFTLAAKTLKMSKSGVSQHIKRLEAEIGHQLLLRNTRGMTVTAAGLRLLARSELLKGQIELALQEVSAEEQAPSGPFSITFPRSFEPTIVIPALRQLCEEFPGLHPRIIATDEPLDLISRNLDVAIFAGNPPASAYRAQPLGTLTEHFCASPDYLHQHGTPETLEDLHKHRWIATQWQENPLSLYTENTRLRPYSFTAPPFSKCESLTGVVEMTKLGMGLAFLPEITLHPHIEKNQLVSVLGDYHGPKWPVHFMHAYQGKKPLHLERFHQLVRHFFRKTIDTT